MIASVGESLADFTPIVEHDELRGFDVWPGGSPYNVALAVSALGYPAAFIGRISTDLFGEILFRRLQRSGIDTSFVARGEEPSTLAFVAYDGADATYDFRGERTADALLQWADVTLAAEATFEAMHFGSISLLREPAASSIEALIRAHQGRTFLSFDPNIRPGLITDWQRFRTRISECARLVDLVKVSDEDLSSWAVTPEQILGLGAVGVVVTRGAGGSRAHTHAEVVDSLGSRVRVVDTIGAGDTFTAGLLVALAQLDALSRSRLKALDRTAWLDVLSYATAAALLTCQQRGPQPPSAADMNRALETRRRHHG